MLSFVLIQEKKRKEKSYGMAECVFVFSLLNRVLGDYSGVRGGGKCPEEEHTTCSGGPTN